MSSRVPHKWVNLGMTVCLAFGPSVSQADDHGPMLETPPLPGIAEPLQPPQGSGTRLGDEAEMSPPHPMAVPPAVPQGHLGANHPVPTQPLAPYQMTQSADTPPPGTLGQTYRRRSILIEDDKHPRVAAVLVKLPENTDFVLRGLKTKWDGKVWRLESEQPLVPGLPHIYAIRARWKDAAGTERDEVRWVRLIMGRIVELDF